MVARGFTGSGDSSVRSGQGLFCCAGGKCAASAIYEKNVPQRLKPDSFAALTAQLKLCPCKTGRWRARAGGQEVSQGESWAELYFPKMGWIRYFGVRGGSFILTMGWQKALASCYGVNLAGGLGRGLLWLWAAGGAF